MYIAEHKLLCPLHDGFGYTILQLPSCACFGISVYSVNGKANISMATPEMIQEHKKRQEENDRKIMHTTEHKLTCPLRSGLELPLINIKLKSCGCFDTTLLTSGNLEITGNVTLKLSDEAIKEREKLREENERLKWHLENLNALLKDSSAHVHILLSREQELLGTLEHYKKELEAAKKKITADTKLTAANASHLQLEQENKRLRVLMEEIGEDRNALWSTNFYLKAENEKRMSANEWLNANTVELTKERNEQQDAKVRFHNENKLLTDSFNNIKDENELLKYHYNKFREEKVELKAQLKSTQEDHKYFSLYQQARKNSNRLHCQLIGYSASKDILECFHDFHMDSFSKS